MSAEDRQFYLDAIGTVVEATKWIVKVTWQHKSQIGEKSPNHPFRGGTLTTSVTFLTVPEDLEVIELH